MDWWQALILGLVEGLTEYLPVSSTGHLLVAQRLLGIEAGEAANAYAIVIQAGAIAAVLGLYRRRVAQIALGLTGRDRDGKKIAMALGVAFVPAATLGLLAGDAIESYLFGPWPVAAAWAAGGFLLLAIGHRFRGKKGFAVEEVTLRAALIIGVAQCAALWPGVSRSLATILGGLGAGLSLVASVEFSFLLGLITLGAATAYKALDSGPAMLEAYGVTEFVVGFVAAWASAVLAVKWMVAWLNERGLRIFGWWRLAAAATVVVMWFLGMDMAGASTAVHRVRATVDPRMQAVLHELAPLEYTRGALPAEDVSAHVRAASALRRNADRLVVVQDNANVLALHEPGGTTEPLLLPPAEGGVRMFDDGRGNKHSKMDLEACAALPDGRIVALGSGSTLARDRLVVLDGTDFRIVDGRALYDALRAETAFSGSELNVEGAVVVGDRLQLLQRGNGARIGRLDPVNATVDLALDEFLRWLDEDHAVPPLGTITQYDLGDAGSVPYTFTDAASLRDGRIAFVACAEASPDTVRDGEVLGCRFGVLDGEHAWMTEIRHEDGKPTVHKVEGIEPRPDEVAIFDVVVDRDRPESPALLGRLEVTGAPGGRPWIMSAR